MSVKTNRRSIRSSVFEPRSCASRCQVRDESLNSRLCQAFFWPCVDVDGDVDGDGDKSGGGTSQCCSSPSRALALNLEPRQLVKISLSA